MSDICTENKCSCTNGDAAVGADCPGSSSANWVKSKCTKCNASFVLKDDKCECDVGSTLKDTHTHTPTHAQPATSACFTNNCSCSNGDGAVGSDCALDGAEMCSNCWPGFKLGFANKWVNHVRVNACFENTCSCTNGDGAMGTNCLVDESEKCANCDASFVLKEDACECDIGFTLYDSCVVNKCQCYDGVGAVGSACPVHESYKCTKCDASFVLKEDACEANTRQTTTTVTTPATFSRAAESAAESAAVRPLEVHILGGNFVAILLFLN